MNEYQHEQLESFQIVCRYLANMSAQDRHSLTELIAPYLLFRSKTDQFLSTYFSTICSRSCYQNRLSACCSKDGIITFFADMVINLLGSNKRDCAQIENRLQEPNTGHKCIYLAKDGCLWTIKPIVCQMFLCDRAQDEVFGATPLAQSEWEALKTEKKTFTWPDKPVLFDQIESIFIKAGAFSTLMYLHNSPGLLRVKKKAGLL